MGGSLAILTTVPVLATIFVAACRFGKHQEKLGDTMARGKRAGPYKLDRNGLVATLRDLVDRSEISRYEISQRTGVAESVLSRCYHGARIPTVEVLQMVATCVGARVMVQIECS